MVDSEQRCQGRGQPAHHDLPPPPGSSVSISRPLCINPTALLNQVMTQRGLCAADGRFNYSPGLQV